MESYGWIRTVQKDTDRVVVLLGVDNHWMENGFEIVLFGHVLLQFYSLDFFVVEYVYWRIGLHKKPRQAIVPLIFGQICRYLCK